MHVCYSCLLTWPLDVHLLLLLLLLLLPAERGTVPVTYQFNAGKGNAQTAVADVKAGVQSKGVQAVFMATNNLTFAAGEYSCLNLNWHISKLQALPLLCC
jgi:hypothetical protein